MNQLLAIGAIVNSALYLAAVFVAALVVGARASEFLSIAGFGATYLSYILDLNYSGKLSACFRFVPILVSAAAGIALLLT